MLSLLEDLDHNMKIDLPAGHTMLAEGAKTGKLFVLVEGTVGVVRNGVVVATVSVPGSVFGEMSLLLDSPHTATVRAVSDVSVYEIADATIFLRSDPEITFIVARMLAQRLNSATTYLVDLKTQYASETNHLGMVSDVLASLVFKNETEFNPGSDRLPDPQM